MTAPIGAPGSAAATTPKMVRLTIEGRAVHVAEGT